MESARQPHTAVNVSLWVYLSVFDDVFRFEVCFLLEKRATLEDEEDFIRNAVSGKWKQSAGYI